MSLRCSKQLKTATFLQFCYYTFACHLYGVLEDSFLGLVFGFAGRVLDVVLQSQLVILVNHCMISALP